MIILKRIRWKNILSTGDLWTEIELNKSRRTLISGVNGSGKSTILDVLCFNWFGKAYRNINKNQLLNSINNKDGLTETEFEINGVAFLVRRGIKPNIFEIYQNGNLINQDAAAKDYQKYLEQHILKIEHRSLTQVSILGSANFQPFMQLPTGARRATIEDLLDISIFSRMNVLLKEQQKQLKEEYAEATTQLTNAIRNAKSYEDILATINNKKADHVAYKKTLIEDWRLQLAGISKDMLSVVENKTQIESTFLQDEHDVKSYLEERVKKLHAAELGKKLHSKDKAFYENHDHCDTCKQKIDEAFKANKLAEIASNIQMTDNITYTVAEEDAHWASKIVKVEEDRVKIQTYMSQLNKWASEIQMLQSNIGGALKEISDLESQGDDTTKVQAELDSAKKDVEKFQKMLANFGDQSNYFTAVSELLKDTGIKTKIIRQYLPIINGLINQHLQTLDFFVNFTLDESFNEKIMSRHLDSFSYSNFSEGEKQKINLAVLFAWRQIAKMKNSCSMNLLILDEIMDSSLDADGMDNLMTLLESVDPKTNVVVISHRGVNESSFDRHIKFEKDQNFSSIK